ncbi:hypothetical protein D3C72_1158270 [compost metagenome]
MQRIAATQQHTFADEIHFHLPFVDEQKLFAQMFLEGFVGELGRRIDDERQQAALANLMGQHRVTRIVVAGAQRLALVAAHQAVAVEADLVFGEQLLDLHVQRLGQFQRSRNRRRVQPAFDFRQVTLGHAGFFRQCLKGYAKFFSQ